MACALTQPDFHAAEIDFSIDAFLKSERENRVIDHDEEGSMEIKKREGYF